MRKVCIKLIIEKVLSFLSVYKLIIWWKWKLISYADSSLKNYLSVSKLKQTKDKWSKRKEILLTNMRDRLQGEFEKPLKKF